MRSAPSKLPLFVFEHPEYMSRLFKKKMGITPGDFRKNPGATRLPVR